MGVVRTILLVAFVIVCVLLILLVLIQNEDNGGMGGVFGGQSAAFGSHSASVLTKTTGVLTVLFFVFTFSLALINKVSDRGSDLSKTAAEVQEPNVSTDSASSGSWLDEVEE